MKARLDGLITSQKCHNLEPGEAERCIITAPMYARIMSYINERRFDLSMTADKLYRIMKNRGLLTGKNGAVMSHGYFIKIYTRARKKLTFINKEKRIIKLLKNKKLTTQQVAEQSGASPGYVRHVRVIVQGRKEHQKNEYKLSQLIEKRRNATVRNRKKSRHHQIHIFYYIRNKTKERKWPQSIK